MKIFGRVLMIVGIVLVLSALGQDNYETHAFLHNRTVEVAPFWFLATKFIAGAMFLSAGYEVLSKVKEKGRWAR